MDFVPFSTCVILTVLSTSQMILGHPLAPLIARDPRDHHIYIPPIQYATDLFKNNLFDYSDLFPDYDYQSGTRNPGRAYPNNNDYQNQQGYEYIQHSPNQAYQTSQNSPSQGLAGYPVASPNLLDYNDEQTINANPNLLEMIPIIGGFFSQQPSRSQQALHGQSQYTNPTQLHKPIPKVHIKPSYYQTVPLSKPNPSYYQTVPLSKPDIPNIPIDANAQNFLLTLASNPTLLAQVQSLLQPQKQDALQPSTENFIDSLQTPNAYPQESPAPLKTNSPSMAQTQGKASLTIPITTAAAPNPSKSLATPRPLTASKAPTADTLIDSLQTPNAYPQESPAPLKTNSPAMAQTQGTASLTVPVTTAAAPNPSKTLTTPRPLTASQAPTPDTLSPPKESVSVPLTPSETQLPTTLPAGNVPITSSLPAPSPVPAPPLAIPISGIQ